MATALVIAALMLLVVLHEAGHFLAARAVGIRATKFFLFFPPTLVSRRVGEVEYGIGLLPLGGFVKLPGMFPPDARTISARLDWEVERAAADGSISADDALTLTEAIAVVRGARDPETLASSLAAMDAAVGRVAAATPAGEPTSSARRRETRPLHRLRTQLEASIDDCHPRAYWRASLWRRMTVIAAGPLVNVVIAFVALTGFFWLHVPTYEVAGPLRIERVEQGSAAERAGLDRDSRITWWNGPVVGASPEDLTNRISRSIGRPVDLRWSDEDGDRHRAHVEPSRIDGTTRLGVMLPLSGSDRALPVAVVGAHHTSLGRGVRDAGVEMRDITWGNLTRLPRVLFDREVRRDVSSVVGIVQVAEDVDRAGQTWRYVGVISLVLAVMNLLPLLPLDGGHLLFGVLELLRRGRAMPRASFERYSAVGLGLVLILFFIGLSNDIGRASGA